MKKIITVLGVCLLLAFVGICSAADVTPSKVEQDVMGGPNTYTWTLATNQTTTGDSDTATYVEPCQGPKKLIITTSGGTVNIAFTVYDDSVAVTQGDCAGLTSSTAETIICSADDNISTIKVNSTITSGTVASITLRCN